MTSRPVIAGGIGAALLLATPLIAEFEGMRNDPYRDIVGVPTVCYGETRVPMKRYTREQCLVMLKEATKDFAEQVLVITPNLTDRPYQLAAATSLAYNIGIGSYSTSSVAKQFKLGNFKQGCDNFLKWNKVTRRGKLVVSSGLNNRRLKERKLCVTGL